MLPNTTYGAPEGNCIMEMPRLVITGVDQDNHSKIEADGPISSYKDYPQFEGLRIGDIWKATALPASLEVPTTLNTHTVGPNVNADLKGFNVRYIVFPPKSTYALHTTPTIDFTVVISGQIVITLDDGEVRLNAGDILIQRGTHHGWNNPTDQPCGVLLFIVGADH